MAAPYTCAAYGVTVTLPAGAKNRSRHKGVAYNVFTWSKRFTNVHFPSAFSLEKSLLRLERLSDGSLRDGNLPPASPW